MGPGANSTLLSDTLQSIGLSESPTLTLGERFVVRVVYYESLKCELKTKPIHECRFDERLQTRLEESTRLTCPRLR